MLGANVDSIEAINHKSVLNNSASSMVVSSANILWLIHTSICTRWHIDRIVSRRIKFLRSHFASALVYNIKWNIHIKHSQFCIIYYDAALTIMNFIEAQWHSCIGDLTLRWRHNGRDSVPPSLYIYLSLSLSWPKAKADTLPLVNLAYLGFFLCLESLVWD